MSTLGDMIDQKIKEIRGNPPSPLPKDMNGNDIVLGQTYVGMSPDSMSIFLVREYVSSNRADSDTRVLCTVLWPVHPGTEPRVVWARELVPADPAVLGRQWQELTRIINELFAPAPEEEGNP